MENKKELSRQDIIEYLRRWGSYSVESILEPSCQIFITPGIEGLIGYCTNHGCAIVFGDPVCAPENRENLIEAFHAYCDRIKKNVVYLIASHEFAKWMHTKYASGLITFGEELFLDPQCDPTKNSGKHGISLRGKIRHAEKHGVIVNEYTERDFEIENKIQNIAYQWVKGRRGPQIYTSNVRLFDEREGKRWFYSQQGDALVGGVVLNHLESRQGWALDRIMTMPDAPQGTSEQLVSSIMEALAQEGCRFLTFGATNGGVLGEITGFSKCASFLAHHLYKASLKIFHLHQRGKYWDKFEPQRSPAFLIFKKPRLGVHELKGLLRALHVSFSNRPLA